MRKTHAFATGVLIAGLLLTTGVIAAERINLPRPGEREFILDKAELIAAGDKTEIRKICDKLLTERAIPIIVVTINSMAEHGGEGMSIEAFARILFDQWGIGAPKVNGKEWNRGLLLVVSKNDRKARIELGAGWERGADQTAKRIMDEMIIPKFKAGDYSGGILAGVRGMDSLARGAELPKAARPTWHYLAWGLFAALAVFTVISLVQRGASGWAWLLWGGVFTLLFFALRSLTENRGSGGFSGGSFGGGYSGGGGASGSW